MFLAATLILMSWTAYAQNRTVSGVVADRDGIPLAGVDIVVKGDNTIYTATGGDGRYSITVPDGKSVLYFHLLGFLSQEISLAGHPEDTLNVTLEQDYMNLETVVVTGTRTPRLLKNSPILTRVITVQDIERVDALNIGDLLEAELPGIEFSYAMDQQVTLNMQGFGGNSVLFLVDGERIAGETSRARPPPSTAPMPWAGWSIS